MATDVALSVAAAGDVTVVDCWSDAPPDLAGGRAVRVEPRRWWLFAPSPAVGGTVGQASPGSAARDAAGEYAAVAIGGGLLRATLTGPGWRALLMVAGVFDAEDPGFGVGDCAATVIHHVPVWIVPVASDRAEVYFAASYAAGLVAMWTAAIERGVE